MGKGPEWAFFHRKRTGHQQVPEEMRHGTKRQGDGKRNHRCEPVGHRKERTPGAPDGGGHFAAGGTVGAPPRGDGQ